MAITALLARIVQAVSIKKRKSRLRNIIVKYNAVAKQNVKTIKQSENVIAVVMKNF